MYIQQRNRLNMFDVYSCIITVSYLDSTSDPTLTEEKVYRVMGEVRDWWLVGVSLGVPSSRMYKIDDTHSTEEGKKCALVYYYLQTVHDASWEKLAGALYYCQEDSALAVVKKLFHSPRGMHVHAQYTVKLITVNIIIHVPMLAPYSKLHHFIRHYRCCLLCSSILTAVRVHNDA